MAKGDNYEYLDVTIDTREKDTEKSRKDSTDRMSIVRTFFEEKGAIVERKKLNWVDYSIKGTFIRDTKEYPVNLGIQYKTLSGDFFPSISALPDVLFRAYSEFQDVSLIVEENGSFNQILMDPDEADGQFQNIVMQNSSGKEGLGLYSAYTNFMYSMTVHGVHARSIRSSGHFPMTICSMLKYIVKPVHDGLSIRPMNFLEQLMDSYTRFPGIGTASAYKLLEYIPNLQWLCDQQIDDLGKLLGPAKAKELFHFLHCVDRKKECQQAWGKLDKPEVKEVINVSAVELSPLEMIRQKPCSLQDIQRQFGYSEQRCFDIVMELKGQRKIWKNNITRLWEFGLDQNPIKLPDEVTA